MQQKGLWGPGPSKSRSGQMVNCLRESFLYSEKRARDLLFAAIEEVVEDCRNCGTPMILSRLTRDGTNKARLLAQAIGYEFSNWDPASKAVTKAMLSAGVLLTPERTVIAAGIAAQASRIAALRENYRDLTEAYLIEFLIQKLGDVSVRDHRALAHALFRQFDPSISMEDFEDRVVILLATLANRVVLYEDGAYAIRRENAPLFPVAVML